MGWRRASSSGGPQAYTLRPWPRGRASQRAAELLVPRRGGLPDLAPARRLASPRGASSTCEALVFPAGILFAGLGVEAAPAAVLAALTGDAEAVAAAGGRELQGSSLLVCCHTARDERCGHIGPPLAARLAELLGQQGGAGAAVRVYKSSHVGGHKVGAEAGAALCAWRLAARQHRSCFSRVPAMQRGRQLRHTACSRHTHCLPQPPPAQYAGNVLVYSRPGGPLQPCSGDWFGGLNASNAPAFVDALLAAKVRRWRGCAAWPAGRRRGTTRAPGRLQPARLRASTHPLKPARLSLAQAPSGAAGEQALRPWWRGRVGMSKEEQLAHFQAAVKDIEDL